MSDGFECNEFRCLGVTRLMWSIFCGHGEHKEVDEFITRHEHFDPGNHPCCANRPHGRPPAPFRTYASWFLGKSGSGLVIRTVFNSDGKARKTFFSIRPVRQHQSPQI